MGSSSDVLLGIPRVALTIIDPCLDLDLQQKYERHSRVTIHKGISLDILPRLDKTFDCILLDGDHNWYTVYHELQCIRDRNLLRRGGMIFLHDVGWPYGYRDMYYQPENIPSEYRQPYARGGIVRGRSELSSGSGVNSVLCNAVHEGGPRNGVMAGVKDFLRETPDQYQFAILKNMDGLGVIHACSSVGDNLRFLALKYKFSARNAVGWPKRFTREHFPEAYGSLKSAVGRN